MVEERRGQDVDTTTTRWPDPLGWRKRLGPSQRSRFIPVVYAVLLCLLSGFPVTAPTVGTYFAIPVAFLALRDILRAESRLVRFVPLMLGLLLLLGPLTTLITSASDPGRSSSTDQLGRDYLQFVTLLLLLLGSYWACKVLGVVPALVLMGAGVSAFSLVAQQSPDFQDLIKFRMGPTLPFVMFGLFARTPLVVQLIPASGALALGAYANNRAITVASLVVILVIVLRMFSARQEKRGKNAHTLVPMLVLGLAAYLVVSGVFPSLARSGYFGEDIQRREIAQEAESGLFSSRIELSESLGLLKNNPFGRGPGVMPSSEDRSAAADGFAMIGLSPNEWTPNGNLARERLNSDYLFLHSNLFEMWWAFGLLAFAVFAGIWLVLLRSLRTLLSARNSFAVGLIAYVIARSAWDTVFEPVAPIGYNLFFSLGALLYLLGRTGEQFSPTAREDDGGLIHR